MAALAASMVSNSTYPNLQKRSVAMLETVCRDLLPFAQSPGIGSDDCRLDGPKLLKFPLEILGSDIEEQVSNVDTRGRCQDARVV